MLGQIEDAFAERSASEARLRRFISDASHELRTPVAAVSAYAELFDRGARDRPADLERSMSGIQRETRRMGLLVSDLLLLARLDQGRPLETPPGRSHGARRRGGRRGPRDGAQPPAGARVPGAVTVTGIRSACARSWTTCSPTCAHTRLPTRPRRSACRARARAPCSRSRTRARASARSRPRMSSSASTAATPLARATTAAPASASPSWPRSSRHTGARSGSRACPAAERRSA